MHSYYIIVYELTLSEESGSSGGLYRRGKGVGKFSLIFMADKSKEFGHERKCEKHFKVLSISY